jgi:hypothetical protein
VNEFLAGALCAMSVVATLCFWRWWRDARDPLFLYFAGAFGLLAIHWTSLALIPPHLEAEHRVYLLRLGAFVLLAIGIVQKNRGDHGRRHRR